MFKSLHKINEELTKNKERYLVDFVAKAYNVSDNQTLPYWGRKGILRL